MPTRIPHPPTSISGQPKTGKPSDPRRALGQRIKALRREHQLTQEDLAEGSGMFRTYMSRIESGQANPTLTMLHDIAAAFNIDIGELFVPTEPTVTRTGTQRTAPAVAQRVVSPKPRLSRGRVSR